MTTLHPNFIVGIGGSAGSLEAFKALLNAMPSDTGMAFIFVLHLIPEATSHLAQILARQTKMQVEVASMGLPILANHVYVSPPNVDLYIEEYTFKVVSPRSARNKQIDILFISLSEAMKTHSIGIVLSGYDGDGTEGCKHIKAKGGTTFAQDISAEVQNMPLYAQAAGYIDFVIPLDKIPDELKKLAASLKT